MSSRTQATTKPARAPINKYQKTYHRCVCHQEHKLPLNQLGHLLINNKKHIIDVYVIKNTSYH